jgi:hypothetical protein
MEVSTRQYIAAEVRAEVARQRKTTADVADALAAVRGRTLTRQAISSKMRAVDPFTTEELVAVAQLLNVPVAQFLPQTVEA